jgi:hypothetical protein
MTPRKGSATVRGRSPHDASPQGAPDEYESGHRFGQAWLLTDEGRAWQRGSGEDAQSPVPALRRLANARGREYLRGFYDAVIGQTEHPDPTVAKQRDRRGRRARPITISVALSTEEYATLKSAQTLDGVPTATRVRAMILAYATDDGIRAAIDAALAG